MKTSKTLAVIAAAWLTTTAAWAADKLPAGTLITGTVSGASATLLGLDHLFADVPGSNTTALAAADLEFITGDAQVAVDFFSDGRVQVWNNSDTAQLLGSYTLTFDFAGAGPAITGWTPPGLSGVTLQVLGERSVSISFSNLDFGGDFGSFTAQLNVSAVPEPASVLMLGAGLGLVALRRARRAAA